MQKTRTTAMTLGLAVACAAALTARAQETKTAALVALQMAFQGTV
jgi:hypothetical protein